MQLIKSEDDFQTKASPLPRILIVDDQPLAIRILHQILVNEFSVFMATSGAQALPFCDKHLPDLVLLDVDMPEMDGLEVCRRLKENPKTSDIPVIFVTTTSSESWENACWEAGGVDFVAKPPNPNTLRHRIRSQLTLKRQAEQLRKLAYLDGLTGISNRRYLDEHLSLTWRHCQRYGQEISCLLIDIDLFKAFNDTNGHLAGDDALKTVATIIQSACNRPYDIVARYGGEEFCCVLPDTNITGAEKIAGIIIATLAHQHIEHTSSTVDPYLTLSVGVATMTPEGHTPSDLFALADKRLYQAKQNGRNQICKAEESKSDNWVPGL